jgi:hypothetical protein
MKFKLTKTLRFRALEASFARMKAPVEIGEVKRGSWIIDAVLRPEAVLLGFAALLGPTIRKAYHGSRAEEHLFDFVRHRLFRGDASRRAVQERAAEKPSIGNLTIIKIEQDQNAENDPDSPNPMIVVKIKRKKAPLPLKEFPNDPEALMRYLYELSRRK